LFHTTSAHRIFRPSELFPLDQQVSPLGDPCSLAVGQSRVSCCQPVQRPLFLQAIPPTPNQPNACCRTRPTLKGTSCASSENQVTSTQPRRAAQVRSQRASCEVRVTTLPGQSGASVCRPRPQARTRLQSFAPTEQPYSRSALFTQTEADALLTFSPFKVCQPSCASRSSPLSRFAAAQQQPKPSKASPHRPKARRLKSEAVAPASGCRHESLGMTPRSQSNLHGVCHLSNPSRNSSRSAIPTVFATQGANASDEESPECHRR